MRADIVAELRPETPDIDPTWESQTMRAILDARPAARSSTRRLVRLTAAAAVVATITGGAVVARGFLPSDDLRPAGPTSQGPAPTPQTSATTGQTAQPERTYVPAPGDPKTHELDVIIRDRGISYSADTCEAIRADTDVPDRLAFSGPDQESENRPIEDGEFPIPAQATMLGDGTCEARTNVTVPYAPRYQVGIVREGNGIAGPDDPTDSSITTRGDSQDVVVFNYPR